MSHMLKVITALYPHMCGDKKKRAELISEFIQRRMNRMGSQSKAKGKSWYDSYDWNLVKEFYQITGGKILPEVELFLNEHTLPPDNGMICSELTGDSKNVAEMATSAA